MTTWLDRALADGRLAPDRVGLVGLGQPLWRVYPKRYGPAGFNASGRGDGRFTPLRSAGTLVPTLYAATTLEAALMETVFHDAPSPSVGFHLVLQEAHEPRRVALLEPSADLRLVDLTAVGLKRVGLRRAEVIDGTPQGHAVTRALAAWLHEHRPDCQGLLWTSRQDDRGQAVVLFGDRLSGVELEVTARDEAFTRQPHLEALLTLAERLGAGVMIR